MASQKFRQEPMKFKISIHEEERSELIGTSEERTFT